MNLHNGATVRGSLRNRYLLTLLTLTFWSRICFATDSQAMRQWTAMSGTQLTASFVESSGPQVILRNEAGELIKIDRNRLSRSDNEYLNMLPTRSLGAVGIPKGEYASITLFDNQIMVRSVVFCLDSSASLVSKGISQERVVNAAVNAVKELGANTAFNVILFVDGAEAFSKELVLAIPENIEGLNSWLSDIGPHRGNMAGASGGTPLTAIKLAVDIGADSIVIFTDGDGPSITETKADGLLNKSISRDPRQVMGEVENYLKSVRQKPNARVQIFSFLLAPGNNERGENGMRFYKRISQMTDGRCYVIKNSR